MIDFGLDYVLENDVVRLTPLHICDYQNLVRFSIQEPGLWKYSSLQADTPEKLQVYIEKAIEDRKSKQSYAFLVFDKRTNQYAGCTRFYDIQPENSMLLIGFTWYGKEFQGTGLNKNCKYLLLAFAFESLNMERVEFRADNENSRSIHAMKGIGCTVEGVLRSHAKKPDGSRRDSIVLSILKEEWHTTVKPKLSMAIQQ